MLFVLVCLLKTYHNKPINTDPNNDSFDILELTLFGGAHGISFVPGGGAQGTRPGGKLFPLTNLITFGTPSFILFDVICLLMGEAVGELLGFVIGEVLSEVVSSLCIYLHLILQYLIL